MQQDVPAFISQEQLFFAFTADQRPETNSTYHQHTVTSKAGQATRQCS
jgi:hypothetical protein